MYGQALQSIYVEKIIVPSLGVLMKVSWRGTKRSRLDIDNRLCG